MELIASISASLGSSDFVTNINNDTHTWMADEPLEIGGSNQGPNPYEMMLSALSSCSAITMKMYANRKAWPLQGVDIQCDLVKPELNGTSFIQRKMSLKGPLDMEQTDRLLQIADLSPIHKMLSHGIVIVSQRV